MRLTPKRHAEILARIRRKLVRRFPIGCHVRLSPEGRRACILPRTRRDSTGIVVGYCAGVSPNVRWQYRKTASGYAWGFLTRIRPSRRPR